MPDYPCPLSGDAGYYRGPCLNPGLASLRPKPKPSWARELPPPRPRRESTDAAPEPRPSLTLYDFGDYPVGATKYSAGGGGTFKRTPCNTHKYGRGWLEPAAASA